MSTENLLMTITLTFKDGTVRKYPIPRHWANLQVVAIGPLRYAKQEDYFLYMEKIEFWESVLCYIFSTQTHDGTGPVVAWSATDIDFLYHCWNVWHRNKEIVFEWQTFLSNLRAVKFPDGFLALPSLSV